MSYTITPHELPALLEPFVNAKLQGRFDVAVDLHAVGLECRNADIRGITDTGVERFFSRDGEIIAWADLRKIVIAGLDQNGERVNEIAYEVVAPMKAAA